MRSMVEREPPPSVGLTSIRNLDFRMLPLPPALPSPPSSGRSPSPSRERNKV